MNTAPSPVTAPTTPVASPGDGGGDTSFEQRAAALHDELRAERATRPEPAGERSEDAPTVTPAGPAAPVVSPADSDSEKRRVERQARLAAVTAQTRESVDRKERQSASERTQRELAAAQKRAEDAEALAARRLDVDSLDEAAWLKLAETRGIKPDRVAQWIRDSVQNPERLAEAAALKATQAQYDPKLAAIQAENAALKARLDAFEATQAQAQAEAVEQQQTHVFLGHVEQSATRAPLSAKLLQHDREEFLQIANIAAERIPAGAGAAALLDKIEDILDSDVRDVAQKYAAIYGPAAVTPPATSRASAPTAAAKATTVSNSLATDRATVVEEEDFAKLPLAERARRLSRS